MVTIAEAQSKDSGWYQCTAYNQSGSTATRARILVEVPARDQQAAPAVKLYIPHPGRVILPEYEVSSKSLFSYPFSCFIFATVNAKDNSLSYPKTSNTNQGQLTNAKLCAVTYLRIGNVLAKCCSGI